MTKTELLKTVCDKVEGLNKKQADDIVKAVFEGLTTAICEDGRITYPGFGTFMVKDVAARTGRNPKTKEAILIKASKKVSFKAAPKLKAAILGDAAEAEAEEAPVEVKKEAKKSAKKEAAAPAEAPAKKATKKAKK
ncbi:MAG: HU family DNA-binding protein [Proteobacteria bacterium]|nr:HU family DNA-binding protein [Pseudomonadota bacterium]